MEPEQAEVAQLLPLTGEERAALARVLRVVEDNWWLDEVESALLERIEASEVATALSAA